MSTFGERLLKLRKDKGLSRRELAELCDVTDKSIQNYETNFRSPKNEITQRLAKALGVSVSFLIDGTEPTDDLTEPDRKEILEMASALFAGGGLSEDEQLAFLTELQTIYLDSKKKAAQRAAEEKND